MSPDYAFPRLSAEQRDRLEELERLARSFNERVNLFSEASASAFWQRHVEHSLALAARPFPPGAEVVDWGTGGGFPGLPLAILFPETRFHLVDSVGKKIRAVEVMARRLGLDNVFPWHGRAEAWEGQASYSVSRATSSLRTLWQWHERVLTPLADAPPAAWPAGLYCLKGGDLSGEVGELIAYDPSLALRRYPLATLLPDPYFHSKELVQVVRMR